MSSGAALLLSRKLPDKQYSNQLREMLDVSGSGWAAPCFCCMLASGADKHAAIVLLLQLWTSYKGSEHVVFSNKGFAWCARSLGALLCAAPAVVLHF